MQERYGRQNWQYSEKTMTRKNNSKKHREILGECPVCKSDLYVHGVCTKCGWDKDRGSGRTTSQMKLAPENSVFIWNNEILDYPRELAASIGRFDLKILGLQCLDDIRIFSGKIYPKIIVDHASCLSDRQFYALCTVRSMCCRENLQRKAAS
jgi:hypothetical protein